MVCPDKFLLQSVTIPLSNLQKVFLGNSVDEKQDTQLKI